MVLPASATLTIDFPLDVAPVEAAVSVVGGSPTVGVRTASAPSTLDDPMLENLPTKRDVLKLVNLVPGVSEEMAYGSTQNSAHAARGGEAGLLITLA